MIRLLIDASRAGEGGWRVSITSPILQAPIVRHVSRLVGNDAGFPVVPAEDLPPGLGDSARELATADDPSVIDDVRVDLATRQPGDSGIAAFGGYLHAVLFGAHWSSIVQKTAGESLELALRWPLEEWELARLPWELLQVPDPASGSWAPIAWNAAITRLMPCEREQETRVRISPKVLFIVGTDLNDVSIRPGAEFFTVWERLQQEGILFDFRVLQRATSQQIEDEIESFRPSIVHFICHGDDAGHIDLVSTDSSGKQVTDQRDAQRCLALLRSRANTYPPVVILSACYSGSQADPVAARVDAPLAAALVYGGVPIVVGMGGQVSDLACRLFARRFYEALLKKQPVTDATAEGRRAGMKHGSDPAQSVDWALPMLFLADRLDPAVEIDESEVLRVQQRAKRARRLREDPNPMAFCDRFEVMKAQRALLDPRQPVQVLALEETDYVPDPLLPGTGGKFGKTRVLKEIAARIALDGHLPCLLAFRRGDSRPVSAEQLLLKLTIAVSDAARGVSKTARLSSELRKLNALVAAHTAPAADDLNDAVRYEYELWRSSRESELPARVIREALRLDLGALAEFGRSELESAALEVVLLVDDVHLFDVAARTFIELIGPDGVGEEDEPVPVVFAFSSQQEQPGYQASISFLKKFVEDSSQGSYLDYLSLERFKSTEPEPFGTLESMGRDPLALVYNQYLLHLKPGIVLHPLATAEERKWFLGEMHKRVLGVPSRLEVVYRQGVQELIDITLSQQDSLPGRHWIIERIDDERALGKFRSPA